MSTQQYATSEFDAEGGIHLHVAVEPLSEAATLPQGPRLTRLPQPALLALLAHDAPRSEHDPELVEANISMHPALHSVTGAFADPAHESAFSAHLFHLAFPCHAFLMTLMVVLFIWAGIELPELWCFWSVLVLFCLVGLVGRVLIHCMDNSVRGQQIGSQTWTALILLSFIADMGGFIMTPTAACESRLLSFPKMAPLPLCDLLVALINGSHGMGFVHKFALVMGLVLVDAVSAIAACGEAVLTSVFFARAPVTIVGFVVAHMAEMHLRHSYAEKERLAEEKRRVEEKLDDEKRRLEERVEQLRAEKERLMYDVRRSGRPLDDDDDRSALRRGLQREPSQPHHHLADDGTGSSETGASAPSESPFPSLPPGPPSSKATSSSNSGESGTSTALTWKELDALLQVPAKSAVEPPGAPSSSAGAPLHSAGMSTAPPPIPPYSATEALIAYRKHYAEKASEKASKLATKQGVPPGAPSSSTTKTNAPLLTWAEADRQFYAEKAARTAIELNSCRSAINLDQVKATYAACGAMLDLGRSKC